MVIVEAGNFQQSGAIVEVREVEKWINELPHIHPETHLVIFKVLYRVLQKKLQKRITPDQINCNDELGGHSQSHHRLEF
jgi:hypothetical protein